ncbi:hypothetical protein FQN53_007472 [Emmonsiellopsis sp. PD_33]|nr:hypothetical protein FQN53_007472 [Emmonsiellopsis sp. PD_33]KAK2802331.1 hypothetical protein FQN51_004624 [Onygenales sp. PD_10]
MELIYLDIHVASLKSRTLRGPKPNETNGPFTTATSSVEIFTNTAAETLSTVLDGLKLKTGPLDLAQTRLITLAKNLSWTLLSICSHSIHFNEVAHTPDNLLWSAVYVSIRENAVSIELFAKLRLLDLSLFPIPDQFHTQRKKAPKVHIPLYPEREPRFPHVISQKCKIYHPKYKSNRQRTVHSSLYNPATYRPPPNYTRQPTDGLCALCNKSYTDPCTCVLQLDKYPLLELREYPDKGIGVRSLTFIKSGTFIGEYIGELRKFDVKDTTYALHQAVGKPQRSIGVIDAAVYGNWTRYMNHSCRPAAVFVSAAVGGVACVLVRTVRDVEMFEEVTVDYGRSYFEVGGRVCRCGEKGCRFRGWGGSADSERSGTSRDWDGSLLPLSKALFSMQRFL